LVTNIAPFPTADRTEETGLVVESDAAVEIRNAMIDKPRTDGMITSSIAYLSVRPALEGASVEFGARAYGPHREGNAAAMVEQIQTWDHRAQRPGSDVRLLARWLGSPSTW
jgi:hypothetical protein